MTIKYVYSPLMQRFAYPRHIIQNDWGIPQLAPLSKAGSAVGYGRFIDTGSPFASMDALIDERYLHHSKALAEDIYAYSGNVFTHGSHDIYTYFMAFVHRVKKPGIHYLIEYTHGSQTSNQPHREDYSPLYDSYKEAVHHIQCHVADQVVDRADESYELEISKSNGHTRLIHGRYDTLGNIDRNSLISDYRIIPITITEEVFNTATNVLDDRYALVRPWIHFPAPKDLTSSSITHE